MAKLLSLFLVLLVAASAVVDAKPKKNVPKSKVTNGKVSSLCTSEHCVDAAHRLFTNMNTSADPCVDFEEFTCGRFQQDFRIPEDKGKWYTSFSPLGDTIYERGRRLLEDEVRDGDWEVFGKARQFYKSCMNLERLEELGVRPMLDTLKDLGGWPVLEGDGWSGKGYHWWDQVYKMTESGFSTNKIVYLAIGTDDRDSSKRSIFLDQPSFGLSREFLVKGLDEPYVKHYFAYMRSVARLLGAPQNERTERELKETLLFEMELAQISDAKEDRRNASKLYNPFVLEKMTWGTSLSGHPPSWVDYVNRLVVGHDIPSNEVVVNQNPKYFKKLATVMQKTDSRTVSNYLMWRAVASSMPYLNEEAREIRETFNKAVYGVNADPPRWKTCASKVGFNSFSDSSFRVVAGSMYIQKYFEPEAKAEMLDMIDYLKGAFKKIIEDIDWMDDLTKERAFDKLKTMRRFIAYPDELTEESVVTEYHAGVDVDEEDFYGNDARLTRWNRQHQHSMLREPVDKSDWREHSWVPIVNALYHPSKNAITFPAGILQGLFFNHKVPRYLNFGAIGGVIGHEITHGFDDQGRQYDAEGNLNDWWEKATGEEYNERAKCIIDQYSEQLNRQTGLNLKGKQTQGENIADNGGIKEAYMAYTQWASKNGVEESLPGFETMTPRQMFWVSWGQVWCAKWRDAALKSQIETGQHSPGKYRILVPLSNNEDFAKDFNCPAGSGMNPEKKCKVW